MKPRIIRLIGLARISDPNKEESDDALERQRERINAYFTMVRQDGVSYELIDLVGEVQSAADGDNRPVLSDILCRIARNEADGLIVARVDRLSREQAHGHALLKEFRKKKKGIIFIEDGLNSFFADQSFEMVFSIKLLIAEQQKKTMCANLLDAKKRLEDKGFHVAGFDRYGWRKGELVKKEGWRKAHAELLPVPSELEVVRLCVELDQKGLGSRRIAQELNARALLSRSGGIFFASTVSGILKTARTHLPTIEYLKGLKTQAL